MQIFKLYTLSFIIMVSSFFLSLLALEKYWEQGLVYLNFTSMKFSNIAISFDKKWEPSEEGVLWTKGPSGSFSFVLKKRPLGELAMLIKARSKPLDSTAQLGVYLNETFLGRYDLTTNQQGATYKFFISRDIANKSKIMNVKLKLSSINHIASPVIGMEEFVLQDNLVDHNEMSGFVDFCSSESVGGWAVAGNAGSHVLIRLNGAIIGKTMHKLDRPDLEKYGLPRKAGFVFNFHKAPDKGDKVEAIFLNGLRVPGRKCKF